MKNIIKEFKEKNLARYIAPAKHAISIEIKGLQTILENTFDETFVTLVQTILKARGKVIISGMGKSGYIAHKSAAMLASTGTPSFFIHPGEASHGDMGMISKDDIVILLSASGGSKELNDIIAYCKRYSITLVGLTRKRDSVLGEASDIKIVLENIPETNPVNSPTTSSLMMMAFLDALATTLISVRGFNKDHYKVFHPGGKLGAALVKVEEVMHKGDSIPLVFEDASATKILNEMIEKSLGCTGVLNKKTKNLVGIITDGDIKRQLKKHKNFMQKKAKDIMTVDPVAIEQGSFAMDAVNLMSTGIGKDKKYIQVLFVIDSSKNDDDERSNIKGLIHIQDCFKKGVI